MSAVHGVHPLADAAPHEITATEFAAEFVRRMALFGAPTPARREQVVYFIQRGNGPIKIGVSSNVEVRLAQLQIGNAEILQVLRTESGGRSRERYLHSLFGEARLEGEWFRPTPRLLDYISGIRS